MKFEFNKAFRGGSKKTIVGLQELSKVFGNTGVWSSSETLEQYEKSLYVFAAINKIATKVATIDIKLFQILNIKGDVQEVLNHEILNLLYKVNPMQTRTEFLKTSWINKKLTGEAFWLKIRDGSGKVIELWNLRPDLMTVVSDPKSYILHYEFYKPNGGKEIFAPEDIVHFKDPDPMNPFRGMSPLKPAKSRIETEQFATNFQRNFFQNSAKPDALLLTTETLDGEQRTQMLDAWDEKHQGDDNSSKIGILEGGMTYQQVSISQKEMDYIESLKFTRDDILVALGVPKSVVTTDDINMNNSFTGFRIFLSETIVPEMLQLVEVLNEMMISPDFGEQYYVDFIDPTPSDSATLRADNLAGYGKWLTTNEIRATLSLPPIEGGDVIAVPQSSSPFSFGSDTTKPEDAVPSTAAFGKGLLMLTPRMKGLNAFKSRPILYKTFEIKQLIRKELTESFIREKKILSNVKKALPVKAGKKSAKSADVKTTRGISLFKTKELRNEYADMINKRIDSRAAEFVKDVNKEIAKQQARFTKALFESNKTKGVMKEKFTKRDIKTAFNMKAENKVFTSIGLPFLQDTAKKAGQEALDLVGVDNSFRTSVEFKLGLEKRAVLFASTINETTYDKLASSIAAGLEAGEGEGELTARVQSVYSEFDDYRASMIARTESTAASNAGALEGYEQSEVIDAKEWVSAHDGRTRESHVEVDGEIIPLKSVFTNGLSAPGVGGDASEVINCRCALAPAILDDTAKSMIASRKKSIKDDAITA